MLFFGFATVAFSEHFDTTAIYFYERPYIKKSITFADTAISHRGDSVIMVLEAKMVITIIAEVPDSIHLENRNIDELAKTGRMIDWESFMSFSHPWFSIFSARKMINEFVIKDKKVSVVSVDNGINWWVIFPCLILTFFTFLVFSVGAYKYKFILLFIVTFVSFALFLFILDHKNNNQSDFIDYLKALVLPAVILFIATGLKWLNEKLGDLQYPET